MAVVVDVDSYISVAEADVILSDYFDIENWTNATETTKETALKMATRNIDSLNLRFMKYDTGQPLEFPRNIVMLYLNGTEAVTPQKVKIATAVESLAILDKRASSDGIDELKAEGIKSQSIEGASVTFDDVAVRKETNKIDNVVSNVVIKSLDPWIKKSYNRG